MAATCRHHSAIVTRRVHGVERILVIKAGQIRGQWPVSQAGERAARRAVLRLDSRDIYEVVLEMILTGGLSTYEMDAIIEAGLDELCEAQKPNPIRTMPEKSKSAEQPGAILQLYVPAAGAGGGPVVFQLQRPAIPGCRKPAKCLQT